MNEGRKCLSLGTSFCLLYKEFSVTKLTFLSDHLREKTHFGLQRFAVSIQWKFV